MVSKLKIFFPLILLSLGFVSCGNRPAAFDFSGSQIERPPGINSVTGARGLWIATSDYRSNGWLSRLDLASGKLQRRVRAVGPDIFLVPDSAASFFLLTRNGGDSIELFTGEDARLSASFPLRELSNPQSAARDSLGRVWVTAMESNEVEVLSPALNARVASVDISVLADDSDRLAEPYGIVRAGLGRMAVVAARLERPAWRPSPRAGIALLGEDSLRIESSRLLSVANALQIFTPNVGSLVVLGAGSQDPAISLPSGLEVIAPQGLLLMENRSFPNRIISGAMGDDGTIATIDWIPEESRSCIRHGFRVLVCDGHAPGRGTGFVFYRLEISGKFLFASYAKDGNSELWVIPLEGGAIERLPMEQPISSLIQGP